MCLCGNRVLGNTHSIRTCKRYKSLSIVISHFAQSLGANHPLDTLVNGCIEVTHHHCMSMCCHTRTHAHTHTCTHTHTPHIHTPHLMESRAAFAVPASSDCVEARVLYTSASAERRAEKAHNSSSLDTSLLSRSAALRLLSSLMCTLAGGGQQQG